MAVGYHLFNDFDTEPNVLAAVRSTYDGPLALAVDYMVLNIAKDDIKVRMQSLMKISGHNRRYKRKRLQTQVGGLDLQIIFMMGV